MNTPPGVLDIEKGNGSLGPDFGESWGEAGRAQKKDVECLSEELNSGTRL